MLRHLNGLYRIMGEWDAATMTLKSPIEFTFDGQTVHAELRRVDPFRVTFWEIAPDAKTR